jgi:predicted metal-dependent enzyme (double-stranded beta helix superfamily)
MTTGQAWPWPDTIDALAAAPASHRVLLDIDRVRVLEVVIEPGTREPEHTHQAASVTIVDEQAPIRYYANGALRCESQAAPGSPPGVRGRWLEPEGPHSVENTGHRRHHAIRVELK